MVAYRWCNRAHLTDAVPKRSGDGSNPEGVVVANEPGAAQDCFDSCVCRDHRGVEAIWPRAEPGVADCDRPAQQRPDWCRALHRPVDRKSRDQHRWSWLGPLKLDHDFAHRNEADHGAVTVVSNEEGVVLGARCGRLRGNADHLVVDGLDAEPLYDDGLLCGGSRRHELLAATWLGDVGDEIRIDVQDETLVGYFEGTDRAGPLRLADGMVRDRLTNGC